MVLSIMNHTGILVGDRNMMDNIITTKEFRDGIAFYKDNKEIAFYSNIAESITYNIPFNCINCASISLVDNLFIINIIKIYVKKLEKSKNNT